MSFESFAIQAIVQVDTESSVFKSDSGLKKRIINRYGEGDENTHMVVRVIEVLEEEIKNNKGHHQKIVLNVGGKEKIVSGAYFKRYTPKTTPLHLRTFEEMCNTPKKEGK